MLTCTRSRSTTRRCARLIRRLQPAQRALFARAGMAPSIPGLAGLSPLYIGQQMGAWRARQRRAKEPDCMAHVASLLGPDEISAVAAWLAAQPPPAGVPAKLTEPGKLPLACGSVTQ